MLAMDFNDDAGCLNARVVLAFFASMLAPTGECMCLNCFVTYVGESRYSACQSVMAI